MYGPNARTLKRAFWDELREIGGATEMPCIVCSDFNAIFALEDKLYGTPNLEDIRKANPFLFDLGLLEPSSVGRKFTWTTGQEDPNLVKMDHFLVNGALVGHFPKLI